MKVLIKSVVLTTLASSLVVAAAPLLGDVGASDSLQAKKFQRHSQLVADNDTYMTIDKVTRRAGVNPSRLVEKSIVGEDADFLKQLTGFSNDVLDASKTKEGIDGAKLDKYPLVKDYFNQATNLAGTGYSLSLHPSGQNNPFRSFALIGSSVTEALGMADCGVFWAPKPSVAKSWITYKVGSVDSTLKSWGYHSTPSLVGGGWTRTQTWHWWNCGYGTFRDHALKMDNTTLKEQNYDGWSPRGEPNPELYASGPWPYTVWPAYVYWWHSTH